ncbi:hypothetical protein CSA17_03525 [bacterium DOLJORAL78_65_58]|nr:MAG: hypothetical protein CSB20_11615 [bacterium DOLZORAL124_64_63]PIE76189.1 MAG: hypothetical protein CSA17_03525 [bacterium DOLJORAL78_65_58]
MILCGHAAQAARYPTATDKETKAPEISAPPLRISFDCTAVDTLSLTPGQRDTLSGDTTGGTSLIDRYPCAPWYEEGPEDIYRLDLDEAQEIRVVLMAYADRDFDLFLLGGCDTDSCLVGANLELSAQLEAGTYYLIVDGAGRGSSSAEGPYSLELETRYLGLPPEICSGGTAYADTCGEGPYSYAHNTLELPNLIQTYGCSPFLERGGEIWVAVTVEDNTEITARTTSLHPAFDAALWLFDGCGDAPACLAFADDGLGGERETLSWANLSGETVIVYLAVDSHRAPANMEQAQVEFEITCRGDVPVATTPWGSLRARYRDRDR